MTSPHRKKWILGLAMFAALAGVIGTLWATRSHELLERATRIADGNFRSYVWQSETKLDLLLQTEEFEQRDMPTGGVTLGTLGPPIPGAHVWRASPDGLRLLTLTTQSDPPDFHVTGPQRQSELRSYRYEYGGDNLPRLPGVAWLPDSRRWLAWSSGHTKQPMRLYSVDAPYSPPVPLAVPTSMTSLLGVTPDHRVVQSDAPAPPATATRITIATFGVYPNRALVRSVSFPLPMTSQTKELELAPQGDRLAWLLIDSRRSPLVTMLVRLLPSLAARFPPREGISVWVSRLDGTEMREIGFQQTRMTGKDPNVATDLRWMPDGKHLSFLMNDALYSVPTP